MATSASATPPPVALVGTTASGKSALAMALARARPDVELVSVDSMQVYRGMDIGTAKPTVDERADVVHHCIDIVDPWDEFSVADFQLAVRTAVADVAASGKRPLLVGGTGLYLRSVVDDLEVPGRFPDVAEELDADPDTVALHTRLADLDPLAASRMESTNRRRVLRALEVTIGSGRPFSSYGPGLEEYPPTPFRLIGVRIPRSVVDQRITERYATQLAAGFVEEVQTLLDEPRGWSRTASQALGYRELADHLSGHSTLDDAVAEAVRRTRRFARRQDRWFRRDPRIEWFDATSDPLHLLDALLAVWDAA